MSLPPRSQLSCIAFMAATPFGTSPTKFSQPAPRRAVSARPRGPYAETCSFTSSRRLMSFSSGLRKVIFCFLALDFELGGFAVEQGHDDADVFLHVALFHGAEAHGATAGEAGADAEIDAAGGELVERGEGVGGDRGDAVGGDQHAGAEADAAGLDRGGAHGDEAVGAQHLGVVEPGMGEAEFLGAFDGLPAIRRGGEGDAEFHVGVFPV